MVLEGLQAEFCLRRLGDGDNHLSQQPRKCCVKKSVADKEAPVSYPSAMSFDALELKEFQAQYHTRWEAVETFKAQELAAMTEERAWQIIRSLRTFTEPWRDPSNGTGLVEQQAVFHRRKPS